VGHGNFAEVLLVRRKSTGEQLAMKVQSAAAAR
jgi:hypothetical protein